MLGKVETVSNTKQITRLTLTVETAPVPLSTAFPIGFVYTQYPQQASPVDLYPDLTWTELDFGGAFFRASGGSANAFISTGTLTPQGQATAVNGLSISKTGSAWGNSQTIYSDSQWHHHNHTVSLGEYSHPNSSGKWCWCFALQGPYNYEVLNWGYAETAYAYHTHIIDFYPSVSENISFVVTGSTETRPKNFTVKIWERTA